MAMGGLAGYVWRHRNTPGGKALFFLCLVAGAWALFAAWAEIMPVLSSQGGGMWLAYLAGQSSAPLFLLFAWQYTGRAPPWLSGWRVIGLWAVPALLCAIAVVQGGPYLSWSAPGATTYSYILVALAIWVLLLAVFQVPGLYLPQARLLLALSFFPQIGNIVFALHPAFFGGQDPAPVNFCLLVMILGGGAWRYRWFAQPPLAAPALLENLQDGILLLDVHRHIVQINRLACQLLSLPHHVVGRSALQVLAAWPEIARLCRHEAFTQSEVDLVGNGEHCLSVHLAPLFDTHQQLVGALITVRDVTAQKWAEADLHASQERYRLLVENQSEGIGMVDNREVFTFANPAAERIFGVPPGQLKGRSLLDFLTPENRLFVLKQTAKRRMGEKGQYTVEILRPDGSRRLVEATVLSQWNPEGQYVGAMGVFRDITERQQTVNALRESEDKFGAVIAQSSDAFMLVDGRGILVSWNNACEQLTGLSALEVLGQPFWEVQYRLLPPDRQTPDLYQQLRLTVQHHLEADEPSVALKYPEDRLWHTDGTYRYIHSTVSRIQTTSGILLCYASRDVTDIRLAEKALQARQNYLTLLNAITRSAIETSDFSDMLQRISDRMAEWLGADGCLIILDDESHTTARLAGISQALLAVFPAAKKIPFDDLLLFHAVMDAGQAIVIDEISQSPYVSPLAVAQFPARSMLGVPLIADGCKLGAVLVVFHHRHTFSAEEIHLTEQAAVQMALSIAKGQLFENLRQSEESYRSLAENLPGIVYRILLGELRRIFFYNDQLVALTGYHPGELQDGEFGAVEALILPEDQPLFRQVMNNLLANREPVEVEYRIRHREGGMRYFAERSALVVGSNGTPLYVDGVIFDVTTRKMMEQAEHEQRLLAEALRDTAAALNSILDLDAVLDAILENLGRVVVCDSSSLMLIENGITRIVRSYGFHQEARDAYIQSWQGPVTEFPNLVTSMETRMPVVISDTSASASWVVWPETQWVRSHIHAPIQIHDQVIGFLNLDSSTPGYFTERHIYPLKAFADQAALALENARLYAQSRQHASQMDTLYRIGLAITSGLELDRVMRSVHEQCQQIASQDAFTICLYDAETRTIECPYIFDRDEKVTVPPRSLDGDFGPTAYVIRTAKPVYLPDIDNLDSSLPIKIIHHSETHFRSYVGVPLLLRDEVLGMLSVQSYQPYAYTPEQCRLLETIAMQAAIAIENARLYAEVKRRSIVDELTGLYNRRGLLVLGKRELERLRRSHRSLTVLFMDIDNFRNFNNRYSYAVGDQVLCALANSLRANAREIDLLGRYGGEEFVALLPETDISEAQQVAERLRSGVAAMRVHTEWGDLSVTISIGIARLSLPTGKTDKLGGDGQALSNLFDRAGLVLHQAKAAGKNCVAVEDEP